MKRILALLGAIALALVMMVWTPMSASAHEPSHSVTCEGVTLTAVDYHYETTNTWSITVNGVVTEGTFGQSLSKTVAVPQEGATSTWAVSIVGEGDQNDLSESGTVGPCGEPPVEVPPVVTPPVVTPPVVTPPVVTPPVVTPPVVTPPVEETLAHTGPRDDLLASLSLGGLGALLLGAGLTLVKRRLS